MSVKHVNQYYKQICEQYKEMLENIKDFEQEVQEGLVEPERVDRLKESIAPIKANYERWAYMMFLLHKPNRASKSKGYEARNRKLLKSLSEENSLNSILAENESAMKRIGE